ncbi:hypothetical protein M3649_03500 [Ureibacillus chungkukjangi]|uniref:hypothetical protein n=1 Tax=Ureibacillus chungkukjangi TaxID=1202712 RepID=UPI00204191DD|nr:hypothetical protein [Ureibacillus chungkukjangi]MCM3387195.1 hypothetical protein [Ureibacillus chungkukjangi]
MDVHALKEQIINSPELIESILHKSGFHYVSDKFSQGKEYRCAWDEDSNPTSIRIYKDTLKATYFKTGLDGDLITLVKEKLKFSFPKTLEFISNVIGYEDVAEEEIECDLAFSGIFLEIEKIIEDGDIFDLQIYDERVLNDYLIMPSRRFIKEGIDYNTQQEFKIGYDWNSNRIVLPWYNLKGELIGLMGRLNKDEVEPYENKWYPILKFPKSRTLYGFSHNYQYIQRDKMALLFESEKSVLKCRSKGIDCSLALGGNSLSDFQANNINSLFPDTIIIGLDEGLNREQSHSLAEKLKFNSYFNNKVGYIYDRDGDILKKGSKDSPADLPKAAIKELIKNYVTWI